MLTARGTVTIRPKEVVPIYREEWDATVTDYKYDFVNRDFVSRNGNIYQVKTQRPGQFVPAGIDPASVEGQEYWQVFNNLAPSVTNFLVIVDEDGKPRTLMSGGRIQTNFLNIGSLNMSETRLWGGAEPMTGKGLALVNDPGDRKFVVYENANNYVEMFQREDEWGLKGVNGDANNPIFSLGREYVYNSSTKQWEWVNNNKIAGMEITSNGIRSIGFSPSLQNGSCYAKNGFSVYASGSGVLAPSTGALQAGIITAKGDNALILGLEVIAHGNGYLKEITALKLSAKNDYSTPEKSPVALEIVSGDFNFSNGIFYMAGGTSEVAVPVLWQYTSNGTIPTAGKRLVYVQGNTGGDNPCKLSTSGAKDGQVITIVNTSTNHRINVTGTAKGNHWILEGCCGTFRYLSGYSLWYPERFDW